jgi:glycosyltransferase involved in cell wall biosynthesis
MSDWHVISGEYPPQPGGVSDYTAQLCQALARSGHTAHVWAPAAPGQPAESTPQAGVCLHRLKAGFGVRGVRELGARLDELPDPARLLVQYVPQAFGHKGMNLPFCAWLATRRRERLWVMFHEAVVPFGEGRKRTQLIAAVTHAMAALLVNRADRVLVSTPAWESRLRTLKLGPLVSEWLPVPSTLPTRVDALAVAALRQRLLGAGADVLLGHFGTYGAHVEPLVHAVFPPLLAAGPRRRVLLLGNGSQASCQELGRRHVELRARIAATGPLPAAELALHLAACDVLVQPYPDGLSTRRTSLMAGLALGVPCVSNRGRLSEPEWAGWGAVSMADGASAGRLGANVEHLLGADRERAQLGQRGAQLYREHFSMERTLQALQRLAASGG